MSRTTVTGTTSSSSGLSVGTGSLFTDALVIAGIVLAVLIGLLLFRYGCNILIIDGCILGKYESCWDVMFRKFVRGTTVTADNDDNDEEQQQQGNSNNPPAPMVLATMDTMEEIFARQCLTQKELVTLLNTVTPNESVNEQQQQEETTTNKNNDDDDDREAAILCSICLHSFQLGDAAFVAPQCQHVFHKHCIWEWMTVGGRSRVSLLPMSTTMSTTSTTTTSRQTANATTPRSPTLVITPTHTHPQHPNQYYGRWDCPNCRSPIVTQAQKERLQAMCQQT